MKILTSNSIETGYDSGKVSLDITEEEKRIFIENKTGKVTKTSGSIGTLYDSGKILDITAEEIRRFEDYRLMRILGFPIPAETGNRFQNLLKELAVRDCVLNLNRCYEGQN